MSKDVPAVRNIVIDVISNFVFGSIVSVFIAYPTLGPGISYSLLWLFVLLNFYLQTFMILITFFALKHNRMARFTIIGLFIGLNIILMINGAVNSG
jgi:hypothetical protein